MREGAAVAVGGGIGEVGCGKGVGCSGEGEGGERCESESE